MIITLRAARVNRGFSVHEVARKLKVTPGAIRRYENDSSEIPRELMIDLLNLYQVHPDYTYFGNEAAFFSDHQQRWDNRETN